MDIKLNMHTVWLGVTIAASLVTLTSFVLFILGIWTTGDNSGRFGATGGVLLIPGLIGIVAGGIMMDETKPHHH
jgi:hypothetical protein